MALPGSALAQSLDHRDAARDRCLERERHALVLGQARQRDPVLGQKRLVGGHHVLAGAQRGLDDLPRHPLRAAYQLDHAIDLVGDAASASGSSNQR